jgi:pyruvate dehydrogenase E2 component (dihydrolipoamide acetyltransferase)
MALAWSQIPHVTHHDAADITELEAFRRRHAGSVEARGGKLTLTAFVLKAVAATIYRFPEFGASLDAKTATLVIKHYCHVGVAIDTERGLLVPVIRDADKKSVIELAVELYQLAERVRAGQVAIDEMRGGTITVTNVGALGGTGFTPIINFPEVAIVGLGRARLEPTIQGKEGHHGIEPRLKLPISFSFDHRVNDGARAARFVSHLIAILSDPESFALRT